MGLSKYVQAYRHSQTRERVEDEESQPLLAEHNGSKPCLDYIISATSVPQLDWTNEECIDWLTQLITERFALMNYPPPEYTRRFTGDGTVLWTTTKWEWMQNIHVLYGRRIFKHLETLIQTERKDLNDFKGLRIPALEELGKTSVGSAGEAVEPAKKERWWRMSPIPPAGMTWDDFSTMQLVNTVIFHLA